MIVSAVQQSESVIFIYLFFFRLMLKLKLQYFGHLMRRTDSFEKTLMLGKIEGANMVDGRRTRPHCVLHL